jgi:hypothetical protein
MKKKIMGYPKASRKYFVGFSFGKNHASDCDGEAKKYPTVYALKKSYNLTGTSDIFSDKRRKKRRI